MSLAQRLDTVFFALGYTAHLTFVETLNAAGNLDYVFVFDHNKKPPDDLARRVQAIKQKHLGRPHFFWGHFGFAFAPCLAPPFNYFTILRDPLDWHFGNFRYCAGLLMKGADANLASHKYFKDMAPEQYTNYDIYLDRNQLEDADDYCLRFYLAEWPKHPAAASLFARKHDHDFVAREVIGLSEEQFSFVGIAEYFEETLLYVSWQLNGVLPAPWRRVVMTDGKARKIPITPEQEERTRTQYRQDFIVYEHFRKKFSNQFEAFLQENDLLKAYLDYKAACFMEDRRLQILYLRQPDVYKQKYLPHFMREGVLHKQLMARYEDYFSAF